MDCGSRLARKKPGRFCRARVPIRRKPPAVDRFDLGSDDEQRGRARRSVGLDDRARCDRSGSAGAGPTWASTTANTIVAKHEDPPGSAVRPRSAMPSSPSTSPFSSSRISPSSQPRIHQHVFRGVRRRDLPPLQALATADRDVFPRRHLALDPEHVVLLDRRARDGAALRQPRLSGLLSGRGHLQHAWSGSCFAAMSHQTQPR